MAFCHYIRIIKIQIWIFLRIVAPGDATTKERIIEELHSTPYSAHPGIQRTSDKIKVVFLLEGDDGWHLQLCEEMPSMSDGTI